MSIIANEPQLNRDIAIAFLGAIVDGDLPKCADMLHDDATWWVLGWGERPAKDFLVSLGETIARSTKRSLTVGMTTSEEDRVAVQAWGAFHFAEGIYANSYHYLFRIVEGRIAAGYEYLDTAIAQRFFAGEVTQQS